VRVGLRPASRRVLRALGLGIAVSLAVTLLSRIGVLSGWETRAMDTFLFLRQRQPEPEIVLVTIDDDAFESLGEQQPLPRQYLSTLAAFLLRSGARVVALDFVVKTATDPAADAALVELSERVEREGKGRLVFAAVARPRPGPEGERYEMGGGFSSALRVWFGFSNTPVGRDGIIRRMQPVLPAAGGGFLPSFALVALAAWNDGGVAALESALRPGSSAPVILPIRGVQGHVLGREPVTLTALSQAWRVDFAGLPGTFVSFPSGPLVQMAQSGALPGADNPFRDRIVLIGATFAESRDFHPTPVGLMTGAEIQAHMIHTLLARRVLGPPPWPLNFALLLGVCVIVSTMSLWLRPLWLALAGLAAVTGFAAVSYEAYVRRGYWLDFVGPLVAMVAYIRLSRYLARRRIRSAFGQYVSVEVLDRVLREGSDLGGEVRTVSVLMSDVRGFTTLSEQLPAIAVSEIMNEYFAAMVDVIMSHRGMVSDFIGDGILAVFGAPLDDPDHAWHAVQSALGMQAALCRLNTKWEAEGRPTLAMGVAVNTGEAFAGNMGSPRKKKYAVLGDTVNTTARIEGLNRDLGTEILIGAGTLALVKDRVRVRDRGEVKVKGKTRAVAIFEVES
jgi:class 3 adenylate cyclase/CHASE2 domain-containing sensor protein